MKIENYKINRVFIFLFVLFLPTQFGKHFFLPFSYLSGVRIDYLAPTIYLTDILAFLLIIFNLEMVIDFLKKKKILLVLFLLIINAVFSLSPPVAMNRFIKVLEWLSLFGIFIKNGRKYSKEIFWGFFLGAIFQSILIVLQFARKHSIQGIFWFFGERYLSLSMPGVAKASIYGVEFLRPYGTFSHPNSMGGFYLLVYVFILLSINNQQVSNILKQVLLFICTLLIFFSFSKIAVLTFLFLNILYILTKKDASRRTPTKLICKPCILAKIFTLSIVTLIFLSAQTDPESLNNRIILIKNSLGIFFKHPFFGVGLGNYLVAQNKLPVKFAYYFQQPVHNIFLLWLTETGIIITGIIVWFIVNKKLLPCCFFALVIIITGFFDHYWLTLQQNFLLSTVIISIFFGMEPTQ